MQQQAKDSPTIGSATYRIGDNEFEVFQIQSL